MHRETSLVIAGRSIVVRTESLPRWTVTRLEKEHTQAVRLAIAAVRIEAADAMHADMLSAIDEDAIRHSLHAWFLPTGFEIGPHPKQESERFEETVRARIAGARKSAEDFITKARKRAEPKALRHQDAKKLAKPFPPVRYTYPEVPKNLLPYLDA